MLRIAIHGAAGRMGRQVALAALDSSDVEIVGAVSRSGSSAIGRDLGEVAGGRHIGIAVTDSLENAVKSADVLIDFSNAAAITAAWPALVKSKTPTVSGTTGLSAEQMSAMKKAAESIPVFHAPNMSLGVNLLYRLLGQAARALPDGYDIEIVETHHRHKKDAPSGTAVRMGEIIAEATGGNLRDRVVYGRQGLAPRKPGDIGIHAVRAGGVVGEHRILFVSEGEQIEFVHRAFSRQTFAAGALTAARFLVGKSAGLYGMEQLLRLS